MKRTSISILLPLLLLILHFGGCQKSPINGDLDGQWEIMSVTPEPAEQIITTRMYMGFYLHVCQLYYYGGGGWTAGNMVFDGSTLTLDFPYAVDNEEAEAMLRQYGINRNPVVFEIETLTKDRMVLRDGATVVTLRKF